MSCSPRITWGECTDVCGSGSMLEPDCSCTDVLSTACKLEAIPSLTSSLVPKLRSYSFRALDCGQAEV
jgi:hypothetical protein